jgi:CubicO group peptidase (beta-lactamase class C family)
MCRLVYLLAFCGPGLLLDMAPPAKRDIPVTGNADPRLAAFDRVMLDFLQARPDVPGATLAVARDGKLVYARGFGHADLERKQSVQPNALFRIASVSKPITGVAILQLVERGKVKLGDRVFDVLDLQEPQGKDVTFDPRWRKVTVEQLLHHTGGWDRGKSFDPMFRSPEICRTLQIDPPAPPEAIIRYMLRHPLDFEPGTRHVYSNFGYCLLGRVIEKVSGKTYEAYVRQEVLLPLGIRDMHIGHSLAEERFPGEVWYDAGGEKTAALFGPQRGKPVPVCYGGWSQEALDSHGGWVASAPDLVRFAAAFNQPRRCPILNADSIHTLFARPEGIAGFTRKAKPRPTWYACGWEAGPAGPEGSEELNTWHNGSLPGTSTLLVRRADGLTWAVLFNSRAGPKDDEPCQAIDPLLHRAAAAVKDWP